jgi:hypothetical protein
MPFNPPTGGGGGSIPPGSVIYQGTWNANANTPALSSGVGTKGHYYVVSVAGNTIIDGITDWQASDWIIFNGSIWEKVDNSEPGDCVLKNQVFD